MDDSAGAEAAYQEALALNERLFGAGSSRVATVHHNLATLYAADRRWADTEAAASAALAIEEQLASGQYLFALSRMWRAKARASLGRFAEAAEDERLSNELRLRTYPPDDARVRASRSRRVLYLAAAGSWREALGERVQLHLSAGRLAAAPEAESRAARRDAALASLLLLGPEWDAMDAAGARAVTRRAWRVAQEESLAELAHDAARAGRLREYTLRVGVPALPILHRPAPTPRPSAP